MSANIYTNDLPDEFWELRADPLTKKYQKAMDKDLVQITITKKGPDITTTPGGWKIHPGGRVEIIEKMYSIILYDGEFAVANERLNILPKEFGEAQKQFRALANACDQLNNITANEYELYVLSKIGKGGV